MEPLLTTDDVAAFFRVDVVTIRRMINKGELTAYRVGGEYRFRRADIDDYLERQRLPAQEDAHSRLGKLTERARKLVFSSAGGASGSVTKGAFDRFTDRARSVLVLAQEEAHRLNHQFLGTEHLLLGLVRESDGVAAAVLSNLGVELSGVRASVESAVGRGEGAVAGEICLTARAKSVMDLALDEARRLDHHYIGTEHLLLGLIREEEGVAAKVLRDFGVELGKTRTCVQRILIDWPGTRIGTT